MIPAYHGMKGYKISMSETIHEIIRYSAVSGCLSGPGLLWDAGPHCKMRRIFFLIKNKLHIRRIDQKQTDGKLSGPHNTKNLTILCSKSQTVHLPVEIQLWRKILIRLCR